MSQIITAGDIVRRIQAEIAMEWSPDTVDTFKAGEPETPVTGVAVTMFPTMDTLKAAAVQGLNFVIAHEPAFYGHQDDTTALRDANDQVLAAKLAFIEEHKLVLWRFHDYWHLRQPDGIFEGMVEALGWDSYRKTDRKGQFQIPPVSLAELARELKSALGIKSLRVVGNPNLIVSQPALSPGAPGFGRHLSFLQRPDVDALLIGEIPEWETIAYVHDASAAGQAKALIILGHIPSEQAGMEYCARWLSEFVPEVPVQFIANPELFWPVP